VLKFFRKYNKIILGFGFALLMVVFLLPQGVSQIVGDPRQRTAYAYDGGRITEAQLLQANQDVAFLKEIYPPLAEGYLGLDPRQTGLHWALLVRLAEDAGYVGGPDDGRSSLRTLAEIFAEFELRSYFGPDLAAIASQRDAMTQTLATLFEQARARAINSGRTVDAVDRTLARVRGVLRLYEAYLNTVSLSERELARQTRDAYATAVVDAGQIAAASKVTDETPEPTELEIIAAFDEFKDVRRGEGRHGFGYLRPPAVRLEWLLIPRSGIADAVVLDPVEVNAHWRANRDRYTGTSFSEDRPRVERELRDRQVERVIAEIQRAFKGVVLQNTGRFETGPDGKPIPPADWAERRPLFSDLARLVEERAEERTGIDIPTPQALSDPRWLAREDVAALPVVGNARIVVGRRPVALDELVFSLPELGGDGAGGLIAGVAHPEPLIAQGGDLVFIRVDAVRPESPPASVAEVRAQIVNDLKTLYEYERLAEGVSELEQAIIEVGLEEAMRLRGVNTILADMTVRRDFFSRTITASEEDAAAFRDAIMDKAAALDPTVPATDQPIADRVVAQAMPSALAVVAAVIKEIQPVTTELYQTAAPAIFRAARNSLQSPDSWPFRLESLIDRFNVVGVSRSLDEGDDGEPLTPDAGPDHAADAG